MADQLGRSVGDMYVGALYPALMIIAVYCAYIFIVTYDPAAMGAPPCRRKPARSAAA